MQIGNSYKSTDSINVWWSNSSYIKSYMWISTSHFIRPTLFCHITFFGHMIFHFWKQGYWFIMLPKIASTFHWKIPSRSKVHFFWPDKCLCVQNVFATSLFFATCFLHSENGNIHDLCYQRLPQHFIEKFVADQKFTFFGRMNFFFPPRWTFS